MMTQHTYLGVNFEVSPVSGMYCVLFDGVPVTGTHSQSRGEAAMRFMLMLEQMQDMESKPMQIGDVLEYVVDGETRMGLIDKTDWVIHGDGASVPALHIREGLGGGEVNFRGPSSAYNEDQTPKVSLSGGPFITRPKTRYEWAGVAEVEFWAWKSVPEANGEFKYVREVNVWKEVTDAD